MQSNQFEIAEGHAIEYANEEHYKRSVGQYIRKVKNPLLMLLAYACPNNTLRVVFHRWRGVHIGKHVYIGMFCFLDNLYPEFIYIEDSVSINAESMLLTHFNPRSAYKGIFLARVRPVLIKKEAIVSVKCTILPGVEVGEWATVSSGTVVDQDVPAYTIASGNPMKLGSNYRKLVERQLKRQEKGN